MAEVGLVELVGPLLDLRMSDDVDADDVVAEGAQLLTEESTRAAQVQDLCWRTLHPAEDGTMRAVEGLLERVLALGRPSRAPEPCLLRPIAHDVGGDVTRVTEAVDVADLVAVVGRDRDLLDGHPSVDEPDDDLGVEVEPVGVRLDAK